MQTNKKRWIDLTKPWSVKFYSSRWHTILWFYIHTCNNGFFNCLYFLVLDWYLPNTTLFFFYKFIFWNISNLQETLKNNNNEHPHTLYLHSGIKSWIFLPYLNIYGLYPKKFMCILNLVTCDVFQGSHDCPMISDSLEGFIRLKSGYIHG